MATRFEDTPQDVIDFVSNVQEKYFPNLSTAIIKIFFDVKKRKSEGKFVLARIKKANDEIKILAMNDDGSMPDYLLFIDKNVWQNISDTDKEKLIYHEFCHCEVDFEKENPYMIKGHEIQTFYDEIEFVRDDPRWIERVGAIASHVYDPDNNEMPEDNGQ